MDEVREFCTRVLGQGAAAEQAAQTAIGQSSADRLERLNAAAQECRLRAEREPPPSAGAPALVALAAGVPAGNVVPGPSPVFSRGLGEAVAHELALAVARLPEPEREVLALRELLGLSYEQIAAVMALEPATVAPTLASARLALRAARRGRAGDEPSDAACAQRDRALRALTARQDSASLPASEEGWLLDHLRACRQCTRAHAAMLEASVCYQAWRPESVDDGVTVPPGPMRR